MDNVFPTSIKPFIERARLKEFPKGQIIMYEGDTPNDVFLIKKGAVKVHDISDHGDDKILHILHAGSVMPFAFFSGDNTSVKWFYTTLVNCQLYIAPQAELRHFLLTTPRAAVELTQWFSNEVHELLVRLSSMGKSSSQEKLISALTFLAVCDSTPVRGNWVQVNFPVTHQLLADMIGVTRESTAISMKHLQKDGIIRYARLATLQIHFQKITSQA